MKDKKHTWRLLRIAAACAFMLVAGFAFAGVGCSVVGFAEALHVQFGPSVMRSFMSFSLGALVVVLAIAAVTFVFGRFYCSVLCPLGITQDVVGWVSRRSGAATRDHAKLRYAVAGVTFGMMFAGWGSGFKLLDPYSNFGRIAAFGVGGAVTFAIIAALVVWKGRIFCTALCPVGTLLGLIARRGVYGLALNEKCVKCGKCVKACPSGCIDPESGALDNERCVRCMNCVASCPVGGVGFARAASLGVDMSRRAFIINGGVLVAGLAAGAALAKFGAGKLAAAACALGILPPGAGDAERFASKCTACQLCAANCPAKIIVASHGCVSLDLYRGECRYDCVRCSEVCPTGALNRLTLEQKRRTKIAEAEVVASNCIAFTDGTPCGKCAEACPTHALTLRANGTPRRVNGSLCIGCGACMKACPTITRAIVVNAVDKQTLLDM